MKHRGVVILLVVFLFACTSSWAKKQSQIDSTLQALRNTKDDTIKVEKLITLCPQLQDGSRVELLDSIVKVIIVTSEKIGFTKGLGEGYRETGKILQRAGKRDESIKNYQKALKVYSDMRYSSGIGLIYSDIADVYIDENNYPEALSNELLALKYEEHESNKPALGVIYEGIGNIYHDQGDDAEALNYYLKGLDIYKELNDKINLGNTYGNMANIYSDRKENDKALNNYLLALKIFTEINNPFAVGLTYLNIGDVLIAEKKLQEALENENKSLNIFQKINARSVIGYTYINLSDIMIRLKKLNETKIYLDSALVIGKKVQALDQVREAYHNYSQYDSAAGNYGAAFDDYKKYIVFRDSLKNDENTKKIVSEQMQFKFDKQQAAEKAEQDKKDAVHNVELKRQNTIIYMVSAGLVLVLILAAIILRSLSLSRRKTRIISEQKALVDKKNVQIEQQKALVEEKNKEVLDSINYAKRLQDAILPPIIEIKKNLPESFVLYKPKDIVAGDFYWMERLDDVILIAACDCTGHGVPGALVSVVCSNALNRALKEFKIRDTGKMLDKVRELVIETFEKSEGEVKDGMDISFCALTFNGKTTSLEWSGANNPLWIMKGNTTQELLEVSPDKQPVGKQDGQKPFTTHILDLNKGDTIYLFTDGYADQFGGPKGKKFKAAQFKEKLLSMVNQSMDMQRQILDETLNAWKGNLEQIDDILVIGIRV
jgi:tetratricopeptide (TPR) repeat protein